MFAKSSASGCCLVFAWIFANFSLALLIKLLLIKKAWNVESVPKHTKIKLLTFLCIVAHSLYLKNGCLHFIKTIVLKIQSWIFSHENAWTLLPSCMALLLKDFRGKYDGMLWCFYFFKKKFLIHCDFSKLEKRNRKRWCCSVQTLFEMSFS